MRAGRRLIQALTHLYGPLAVYGHGEIQTDKQADEGRAFARSCEETLIPQGKHDCAPVIRARARGRNSPTRALTRRGHDHGSHDAPLDSKHDCAPVISAGGTLQGPRPNEDMSFSHDDQKRKHHDKHKTHLTSKTIIAALVGIALVLLDAFYGLSFDEATAASLIDNLTLLVVFAGTIWGRLTAKKRLT